MKQRSKKQKKCSPVRRHHRRCIALLVQVSSKNKTKHGYGMGTGTKTEQLMYWWKESIIFMQ